MTDGNRDEARRGRRWALRALWLAVAVAMAAPGAGAQLVTVGAGALVSERPTDPVWELHGETPPFAGGRAYATLSWTDDSAAPTVITAWERPVLHLGGAFLGIGAGLLWLEVKDYEPDPMVVSSTVIPLPIPRTSFVFIASTTPFDDWDWSLVFKVGVTALFVR